MSFKGIDVSKYQGTIDWGTVKPQIDFAILRAGYGSEVPDEMFERNAKECERLGIPYGAYWFSYAYTVDMAQREAEYFLSHVKGHKLSYPLAFDYEYDSYNYAVKNGVTPTADLMCRMATAFLTKLEEAGYYAVNYTNVDFYNRGFKNITSRFDTWLAHWGVSNPSLPCGMWQYTSDGSIKGIAGRVDCDIAYKDYPTIISGITGFKPIEEENPSNKAERIAQVHADYAAEYDKLAQEVMDGKWGNGEQRILALRSHNNDPAYVQKLVNILAE